MIKLYNIDHFVLEDTFLCGQAFRWKENADKSWTGVVRGIETTVTKTENGLLFQGITAQQFTDVFYDYFDFSKDYAKILSQLSQDETLKKAIDAYGTIRILNQEPWEALCSFIISACNNIPRIKGIVERLCEAFGASLYAPKWKHGRLHRCSDLGRRLYRS